MGTLFERSNKPNVESSRKKLTGPYQELNRKRCNSGIIVSLKTESKPPTQEIEER